MPDEKQLSESDKMRLLADVQYTLSQTEALIQAALECGIPLKLEAYVLENKKVCEITPRGLRLALR